MSVLGEPLAEDFFVPNHDDRSAEKEATMANLILVQLAHARTGGFRYGREAERLRRAGYADGDRRPRIMRPWTNR